MSPRYTITNVDAQARSVDVMTQLRPELSTMGRLSHPLFPDHPIEIAELGTDELAGGNRYRVSFRRLEPEPVFPPIYPSWREDTFVLPLWSLLPVSDARSPDLIEVVLAPDIAQGGDVRLLSPAQPALLAEIEGFCLVGGYSNSVVDVAGTRVTLHYPPSSDGQLLVDLTRSVLTLHRRTFDAWLWQEIHLLYEEQRPRLKKQKGMLFTHGDVALGRYVFQSLAPDDRLEQLTQTDLIEHEILHYYIDTTALSGTWWVEGLTTYVSRRILREGGLFGADDWDRLVDEALGDCRRNPLCHTSSLTSAAAHFWDPRYANVIYNKGFLVACLLDDALGGRLVAIAQELFQEHGKFRRQFTAEQFEAKLPAAARRKLAGWLRKRDLAGEFRQFER